MFPIAHYHTQSYGEKKWHKVFAREVSLGRFKEIALNYFSEAFIVSFWTK